MARRRVAGRRRSVLVAGLAALAVVVGTLGGCTTPEQEAPSDALRTPLSTSKSHPPAPAPRAEPSGPSRAQFDVDELPKPSVSSVYSGLAQASGTPSGWNIATPRERLTPAWSRPDASRRPVLALERRTFESRAAWLVTDSDDGWVEVLVPLGRGALPSDDPEQVNRQAVWVERSSVEVAPARTRVVIDVSDRSLTVVRHEGESVTVPAAVGVKGVSDTPRGVFAVAAHTTAQVGDVVLLTAQSERLDGFYGTSYAATAIHVGTGVGRAVSNGCVRLTADAYAEHVASLPVGTPVIVRG